MGPTLAEIYARDEATAAADAASMESTSSREGASARAERCVAMTSSLASMRLSDPPMTADERGWYALGFEAALRGESDLRDSDDEPTAKQDAAWNRGHADATREESAPSQRALLLHREDSQLQQPTTLEMAVARKVAKRTEVAERDAAARERIANALERLCAWVEKLP